MISRPEAFRILNDVRSALANLDPNDRSEAIRAALMIGWELASLLVLVREEEKTRKIPLRRKRWGEMGVSAEDVLEILDAMANEMDQAEPVEKQDRTTVAFKVIEIVQDAIEENRPVPDSRSLMGLAVASFRMEWGRDPRVG